MLTFESTRKEMVRMSNHNIVRGLVRLVIFVVAFVLGIFTMIGIQAFMEDKHHARETSGSSGSGVMFFANDSDDCKNHATDETNRLYGPLSEQVANNGLSITVLRGSVWRELELAVLDAQIGAEDASIRNFDNWAARKAQTRPERERITANLLAALRRQENSDLNVVPPNSQFSLRPVWDKSRH